MILPSVVRFFSGQLRLALSGPAVERFIQAAVHSGAELWRVTRRGEGYEVSIRPADFARLRPLARRTHTRVRIIARSGLPAGLRGPVREAVFAGLLIFATTLYILSAFVWRVEVTGLSTIPEDEFVDFLERAGLRVGEPKHLVSAREVEQAVLAEYPQVSWVAVGIEGTAARVQVLEKVTRQLVLDRMLPADIVAAKDGTIETLIVLQGKPAVAEGAQVERGQLLIAGEPHLWEYWGRTVPPEAWPPAAVRARGIAVARVKYQFCAEVPLERTTQRKTGGVHRRTVLRIGVREIILSGHAAPGFEAFEETRDALALRGGRGEIVAELIAVTYHELELVHETLGYRGARLEAEAQARQELGRSLVPGSVIVSEQLEEYRLPEAVGVRLLVEAVEEIGQARARVPQGP